ncbi:MAG: serine/threonine protein kinase [Kastovskya adunca ATA6-11-RM4]|jgi:serine/threonine-protein kinase|nr:serine/threonine protein kinase [Kastovskya adunca ATA6-11-RM4]
MQPPIASGTILQNRYRLLNILGQGGFARTYLAEDQGRFNELCALKELIPAQNTPYAVEKSRELFQREATTLYQIQHPQVPQFRATFEENGRLFLVQDYVEGKTLRDILNQRKLQGQFFSEIEVRQFLLQLLPVLDHIHTQGIIHRDISPDNIIVREKDGLPVLIDFGVVKELATRFQQPDAVTPVTTVGKPGYAPSEQIQSGRAYASSDLYALAVTALVLLTGQEPKDLFDDTQLLWQWRNYANVSDRFARILNQMLSYRPGDRFQSARAATQAIESLVNTNTPNTPKPDSVQRPADTNSSLPTLAVGHRPEPVAAGSRSPNRADPVIREPSTASIWDSPWAVIGAGLVLTLLAGLCSWAVVSAIMNARQQAVPSPISSPTPTTPTITPSATPTVTPSPQPQTFSRQLNLFPGTTVTEEGNLRANTTANYIISGEQGQRLSAGLRGEGVLMTVLGPDQNPVDEQAVRAQRWEGTLPFSGDYTVQLRTVRGLPESDYRLNLTLTDPPEPTPEPTPDETPAQTFDTEVLRLSAAGGQVVARGATGPQRIKRYVVNIREGEQLMATVQQGDVTFDLRSGNGQIVQDLSGLTSVGPLPLDSGQYFIDVIAKDRTNFTMAISVQSPTNTIPPNQ